MVWQSFFEIKNFNNLLILLEEIFQIRDSKNLNADGIDIENGKDKIVVNINSVFPHNAGKPTTTLHVGNIRPAELDLLQLSAFDLHVSLESGQKLMQANETLYIINKIKSR